jgi:4-amino-4-deoxy-L-arabinose transferase-like glycosyltransferase
VSSPTALDDWLAKRRWFVLAAVVAISLIARVAYYLEVISGPLVAQHRWEQTDMCYFDQWARDITAGDWLSRNMGPPLHAWHLELAQGYLRLHPEELARLSPTDAGMVDDFFERLPEANSAVERLVSANRQGKAGDDKNLETRDAARKEVVACGRLWEEWLGPKRFYQEPLYPYLVAVTYAIAGPDVRHVFLWQLGSGVLSNVLIYLIARRHFGETTAAVAGLLAALCSPLLYFEAVLLRETLIVFAGLALVWLAGEAARRRSLAWWLLAGVAMGLALMLKSHFALFLLGTLVLLAVDCRRRMKDLVRLEAVAIAGILIGFAPLVARNVAVGVSPLAAASASGVNFLLANANEPHTTVYAADLGSKTQAVLGETGGRLLPTVLATLKTYDHLGGYVKLLWDKLLATGLWFEPSDNTNFYFYRVHAATLRWLPVTFLIVSPLAIVGLVLGFGGLWKKLLGLPGERTWCTAPHLYLLVLTNLAALLVFFVRDRFRAPLTAALIPFAALTLGVVLHWLIVRPKTAAHTTRVGAVLGGVVLMGLWTARPLPENIPLLRPADYFVSYEFYYNPREVQAKQAGDNFRAAEILADSLRFEPAAVQELGPSHRPTSPQEAALGRFFAVVHRRCSDDYQLARRPQEAQRELARAREIAVACSR